MRQNGMVITGGNRMFPSDRGYGRDGAAVGDFLAGSSWRRFPTFVPSPAG